MILHDRYLALVIADAAGHGVAAAMLAVLFKLRLKYNDRGGDILQPGEAMARLNERLFDMLSRPGSFITAAYALIDLQRGEGKFAAAGHTPFHQLHRRQSRRTHSVTTSLAAAFPSMAAAALVSLS